MTEELIDRLAATPRALAHLVAEVDDRALDAAQGSDWSARTVLAHLRDSEFLLMRLGLERMLAEAGPIIAVAMPHDWAASRSRGRDRKEWLLADFALQRQASVGILRSLGAPDWERGGRLAAGGETRVREFVAAWARHDAVHVAQVEAALGESLTDVLERRKRRL